MQFNQHCEKTQNLLAMEHAKMMGLIIEMEYQISCQSHVTNMIQM